MADTPARLVVGLGNPGGKYRHNRHNIGFMVVEELARRLDLEFRGEDPSYLVATAASAGGPVVLLKPLTYMNLSGQALSAWSRRHGVPLSGREEDPELDEGGIVTRPLVVCDDLALPLGSIRLRDKGRSGGQNGLASIIEHLEGEIFPRLRLGIAPLDQPVDPALWPAYVLADFADGEAETRADLVATAADTVTCWLDEGFDRAVSRFNRRVRPPAAD